ncbi:MAG TPA: peptidylprolyl isomerase [Acidiferrobacterales bacterium]|nr:peptidylprolyl isomerase [Acidiferrobacterales bacterium]
MQIAKHKVVSIDYTLTDDSNKIIDTSKGSEPLTYIHGIGNLIPGLEKALAGKSEGDAFEVTISPQEGYGVHDESLLEVLPRSKFTAEQEVQVGMQFYAEGGSEMQVITVVGVEGDRITIDGNHPLAGRMLSFAIKVVDVRDATPEEVVHGHVHGPDGHHH